MTDVWSGRAELYVESDAHRSGEDLELLVEWARGARTALDVATGGGHVARRLREEGIEVVSCDSAPGMHPDVVCRAEELPFADASFEVVACRTAAHHFADVRVAVLQMARVSSALVLIVDTTTASLSGARSWPKRASRSRMSASRSTVSISERGCEGPAARVRRRCACASSGASVSRTAP